VSVSKGSINRINRIKQSAQSTELEEKVKPDTVEIKPAENVKIKEPKKVNEIHEEKFRLISKIKQDIPDYLL
jgi:hypothetical protein